MYYCRGAVQSAHCAEYWPIPVKQCEYCEWYSQGYGAPHYKMPAIINDVTFRPMGTAIWRCYDGIDGDRFTIERQWWKSRRIN